MTDRRYERPEPEDETAPTFDETGRTPAGLDECREALARTCPNVPHGWHKGCKQPKSETPK